MSLTISIDTYISTEDADAYMSTRLNVSDWPTDAAQKESALRLASVILDGESYLGTITDITQLLSWPRTGVTDAEGREIASSIIPATIQNATAELAIALIRDDLTQDLSQRHRHQRSEMVGQSMATFDPSTGDHLPMFVRAMIRPYLTGNHSSARMIAA